MLSSNSGDALAEVLRRPVLASAQERVALLHQLLGEPACRQLGIYPIPDGFKLSVVIPVYNEERWIGEVVRRVEAGVTVLPQGWFGRVGKLGQAKIGLFVMLVGVTKNTRMEAVA